MCGASIVLLRESGGGENLRQVGAVLEKDNEDVADDQQIIVP